MVNNTFAIPDYQFTLGFYFGSVRSKRQKDTINPS